VWTLPALGELLVFFRNTALVQVTVTSKTGINHRAAIQTSSRSLLQLQNTKRDPRESKTMNISVIQFSSITSALLLLSAFAAVSAQEPKYKANVPASVTTPDKVQTELLGDLEFFDGMPSKDTVKKAYDFLDTSRGAEAFLNGIPAASVYALLEGIKDAGVNVGDLGIFEELMDARSLFLTPNSTTIYNMFEINVEEGPIVVEVPTGVLGPVDDAYFRYVTDFGFTGPDQGKGGKYLFVHRDYKGERTCLPEKQGCAFCGGRLAFRHHGWRRRTTV
jgi:hypothetical protein